MLHLVMRGGGASFYTYGVLNLRSSKLV